MRSRTALFRTAALATAGVLALPGMPAWAAESTVVDVLKLVDGAYVVETVTVPAPTAEAEAEELEQRPEVVVASPQVVYQVDATDYDPYWDSSDPQVSSRVRDVWPRTRGEGQVVAVLDTASAIRHENLFGAVLPGVDFASGAESPWHGYGVAGVIAARAENGIGSAGMAPAATILPVRVCGDGGCPSASIARGILWAADHGADVINMSLSGVGYSDVQAAAVQYALDKGISVVAATGNDGLNGNPVMYPAALDGVIGVSSINPAGAGSDWAVHGWQTDLSTVGDSVQLTMPGHAYGSGSGTSFSTPAVAGAVALLRSSHPGLSPQEAQAALQAGSDSSGTWDRAYGAGRMDLPGAMAAADRTRAPVAVTVASGTVDLNWDPVPGAAQYTVRIDGVVRTQTAGTTARVTGLTDGNQVAVDVQPDTGARSRPVLATVGPTVPAVPVLHSAAIRSASTSTSAVVDLVASVEGVVAPRYAIIRDGVSIGSVTMALTATPKTFGIGIGAMPTAQTRWQLRPVDAFARVGPISNTVSAGSTLPPAPGAPTGLTGRVQAGEVLVSWDDLGPTHTYEVSTGGSVVARPSAAGVTVPAPPLGESRTYSVAVVDGWGRVGPAASTTVTRILSAPDAPRLGVPSASRDGLTVRWDPPLDDGGSAVTGFTVRAYSGGVLQATRSAGAGTGRATIGGLPVGRTYTITVAATNAVGEGSAAGPAELLLMVPPDAPALGTATPGDGTVVVRWSAPAGDGGTPVTGYRLEASGSGGTYRSATAAADATSATLTGLTNGVAYRVDVRAVNAAGDGPTAYVSPVTPTPAPAGPPAPGIGQVSAGDASALVRWTPPATDGGSALTGYTVRVFRGGAPFSTVTAAAGAKAVTVPGLTNGTTYAFAVAAVNAVGTGPDSARVAATPSVAPGVPGAPIIGTVTPGNGSVVVTWSAPPSNGSPITGYVLRTSAGGTLVKTSAAASTVRSLTVAGLTNGVAHTVAVIASNGVGTSSPSLTSAPVTPFTVPGAPALGTVTGGDRRAHLTWTPPAEDGGSPVTGYVVTTWTEGRLVRAEAVAAPATGTTVTGLANGVAHTFTVAATNAAGAGAWQRHSETVIPLAPVTSGIPGAPALGTPTAGKAAAVVRWAAPSDDGGNPVTGYLVLTYRGGALVRTTTAPASARSLVVNGLVNGTAYRFAVAAVNDAGTGAASLQSTPVVPRTVPGAPGIGRASAARGAAVVRWTAPAVNGGSAVTGYVLRVFSGGKLVRTVSVAAIARSTTVGKLTAGRGYAFRVLAKNVAGLGAASGPSTTVTPLR